MSRQPERKENVTMLLTLSIQSNARQELLEITDLVQNAIGASGQVEGRCLIFCPHTTAGLTINSNRDPNTLLDLQDAIDRLVPTQLDFHHTYDTPSDAAGHIKATLVGSQLECIVSEGTLILGGSQGIFFWEFDGPRKRSVHIKIAP